MSHYNSGLLESVSWVEVWGDVLNLFKVVLGLRLHIQIVLISDFHHSAEVILSGATLKCYSAQLLLKTTSLE